jgi:hypothetical protein
MCFAAVDADEIFESASANGGPLSRAALEALQQMLSTGGGAACAAAAAVAAAVKTSPRRLQQVRGQQAASWDPLSATRQQYQRPHRPALPKGGALRAQTAAAARRMRPSCPPRLA